MEEGFSFQEAVLTLKPIEDGLDSVDLEKSIVCRHDLGESTQKLNTIKVEAFLDDYDESDGISKQIIVQRIDDFISEGQDNHLNDSSHESETEDITVVPDTLNDNDRITQIIAENDDDDDDVENEVTSNYFHNSIEVISDIEITPNSIHGDKQMSKDIHSKMKKETKNIIESQETHSTTDKISNSKSTNFLKRKESIKIDKNDPRSRLHFVKYMKKDGKVIKLWECGICEKEFLHQYTLSRHLPTHTDERNYKCKVCGKAFRQMSTLAQHKATHSEFRPYVCEICQKTFSRVSTLISHKKIHNDNKPHICYICGKGFHQKGNLKNHFFTHTNERPYKCNICGRGFNQASNLQCHKLKTHIQKGNSPQVVNNKYKCSDCSESFSRKAQLRHHEEYVHEIKNVFSTKNSLKPNFIPSKSSFLKRKKMGNIRIIQMTPDDEDGKDSGRTDSSFNNGSGLLIDPIDTKAMHEALAKGDTPFALLKPLKGTPVIVKVRLCDGSKHKLVPATAAELKSVGKFYISSEQDGNRIVQIKVPVVATIAQKVDEGGRTSLDVEPPSDEEQEDKQEKNPHLKTKPSGPDDEPSTSESRAVSVDEVNKNPSVIQVQHFILNPSFGKNNVSREENFEEIAFELSTSDGLEYVLPSQIGSQLIEIPPPNQSSVDFFSMSNGLGSHIKAKEDDGCVHYLRRTENLGEYEVMGVDPNSLTNSQGVIQHLKPLFEENEAVSVDQSHLTALMTALQTAGYQLHADSEADQIILNDVDDELIVDDQHIQMVVSDGQEFHAVDMEVAEVDDKDEVES